MEETKNFTMTELSSYNGKSGKPSYIGFKGKVYDVTESSQWLEGDHLGHEAGQDLTDAMDIAPEIIFFETEFSTVSHYILSVEDTEL